MAVVAKVCCLRTIYNKNNDNHQYKLSIIVIDDSEESIRCEFSGKNVSFFKTINYSQ